MNRGFVTPVHFLELRSRLSSFSLGLAGAVALSRVIASVAFHTNPLEPAVLTVVVCFVALVAALAAYAPAHRATTVGPRTVLQ